MALVTTRVAIVTLGRATATVWVTIAIFSMALVTTRVAIVTFVTQRLKLRWVGKMVRKHSAHTKAKARLRRRRPKTPAPKNGWLLAELAELTGTRASTVRYYVQERLLRPIERRGTATRYERRELLRLLGLLRLRSDDSSSLAEKKRKLDAMGDEQQEQWLRSGPLPPKAARALGFEVAPAANLSAQRAQSASIDTARTGFEPWQRITLVPGLELMMRADAKEAARIIAQRIVEEYLG